MCSCLLISSSRPQTPPTPPLHPLCPHSVPSPLFVENVLASRLLMRSNPTYNIVTVARCETNIQMIFVMGGQTEISRVVHKISCVILAPSLPPLYTHVTSQKFGSPIPHPPTTPSTTTSPPSQLAKCYKTFDEQIRQYSSCVENIYATIYFLFTRISLGNLDKSVSQSSLSGDCSPDGVACVGERYTFSG